MILYRLLYLSEKPPPLSAAQAGECLSAELYQKVFGISERNDDKITVSLNLKIGNIEKLKVISSKQDKPMSSIIDELIENANCV